MVFDPQPAAQSNAVFAPGLMRGKTLFVTGGGSGIGLGICLAFARLGAKVAICGRTESKLAEAAEAIKRAGAEEVLFAKADVRNPDDCTRAVSMAGEKWGKIDVFVNNAAGNFMSLAEDVSPNAFSTVIDIDLRGTFHMAKAALPWLRKAAAQGTGATLLAISATLYYTASPFQGHAAAAKAGIDSLTKTLAAEWSDDGIRVVSIAPGPIADTEGGPTGRVFGQTGGKAPPIRDICPLGRFGTVDDIANTAVFLASAGGSFITGTNVVVDGLQWQATGANDRLRYKEMIRKAMQSQRDGRVKGTGSKGHAGDNQSKL
jgi:peroxisomal 2,4-dienoyl-CoA reductase